MFAAVFACSLTQAWHAFGERVPCPSARRLDPRPARRVLGLSPLKGLPYRLLAAALDAGGLVTTSIYVHSFIMGG